MRKRRFSAKVLSASLSAAMAISLLPVSALAATSSETISGLKDGTYAGSALCSPDEDEEFDAYTLSLNVTVEDGKITSITDVKGDYTDGDEDNDSYLSKAADGTKTKTGMISKIIEANSTEGLDAVSGATCSSEAIVAAVDNALASAETKTDDTDDGEEETYVYVTMNIPYDEFYAAEMTGNDVEVDTVTSATSSKWSTVNNNFGTGAVYTTAADESGGGTILGVQYPVYISQSALDSLGTDLTENDDYYYTTLEDTPSAYKEVTVGEDGSLSFGAVVANSTTELTGVTAELATSSRYGDYQLEVSGADLGDDTLAGIIVTTTDGTTYALRALENIWKGGSQLSWSTGYTTTESHGNTLSYAHYVSMMGKTIDTLTYITTSGVYTADIEDIFVQSKYSGYTLEVADADVTAGTTALSMSGFPSDFAAVYSADGDITVGTAALTWDRSSILPGSYTLTVSDEKGAYVDASASFTLSTDTIPAAFNEDSDAPALVTAEGSSETELSNYISNITSVTVNDTSYSASGRNSATIINSDGSINLDAALTSGGGHGQQQSETTSTPVFDGAGEYEITVSSTGYTKDLTFTLTIEEVSYTYVYAALTYAEYYAAEDVQAAGDDSSSEELDTRGESDLGAFDTVTRATTNHGLHRGSYQQTAVIYGESGNTYEISYWTDSTEAVLTDESTITFNRGAITLSDGTTDTMSYYEVSGIKYVPVAVKSSDYEAFAAQYDVVENGETLSGGYSENQLSSYSVTAEVTADTNGLKTAVLNEDGTFSFSARTTGTDSGIADQAQKSISQSDLTVTVKDSSSYGDFIRVDLTGNYGDLAANMQTVVWSYYPDGNTDGAAAATYGTKFAADNWMHKSNGIQLGLTDSARCTLPDGTDGSGTWVLTICALGYADTTITVEVTADDIHLSHAVSDTSALETAIAAANALTETDYSESSWSTMKAELEEAVAELAKYTENPTSGTTQENIDEAAEHLNAAIADLELLYVLMNIPYADFYASDVNNDVAVDTFTSATLNKTRTGTLAGGSYHVDENGTDITGITFPVKLGDGVSLEDLADYTEITDDSTVTISVTNRGTTSETTYTGSDALFESDSYSWYALSEVPSYYKVLTKDEEGNLTFGSTVGETTTITDGVEATFTTDTSYGDYELDLEGVAEAMGITTSSPVYGVIINTVDDENTVYNYGLRHVENIWRVYELAWCTGFTTSVHNCPTSSAHYAAMMGQTITSVTYYTENGIFEIDIDDIYVPTTLGDIVSVESADLDNVNSTSVAFTTELPDDFEASYIVEGLSGFAYDAAAGMISWSEDALPGSYTLTVTDQSGTYVEVTADFELTTSQISAIYNGDADDPALIAAEGASADEFANYVSNIVTVSVNDTSYAATGRNAVTIINEDGTLATENFVTDDVTEYEITVTSTGYTQDYTFIYDSSDTADNSDDGYDTVVSSADTLVVRRGNIYYFSYSLKSGKADKVVAYGKTTDEVLVGDWDGDGVDTLCVRRGNTYYFQENPGDTQAYKVVAYGKATDEVLVGDWDGDGKDTLCVRRGNTYYFINSLKSGKADSVITYGKATDEVLSGKWAGNASGTAAVKETLAVRRGNTYYISNTLKSGKADKVIAYGKATDEVLSGDWDGDGYDTLMVRRGNLFYISNSLKGGKADQTIAYGKATDEAYAGTWK